MADTNKWEYTVFSLGNMWRGPKEDELEATLNELGLEGWEVVGTYTITNSNKITVVAKRSLSAEVRRRHSWPG
ncbi:MAG: DUF4177 domain-containing protein [Anaerolineales bacterium]|nr:DUF4177 domain-containing protein [Anaerolineales bacterium]